MKKFVLALALSIAIPAFAHGTAEEHAKKGQKRDAPTSFATQPPVGTWAKCPVSGKAAKASRVCWRDSLNSNRSAGPGSKLGESSPSVPASSPAWRLR